VQCLKRKKKEVKLVAIGNNRPGGSHKECTIIEKADSDTNKMNDSMK
jgi:hypothetical protein